MDINQPHGNEFGNRTLYSDIRTTTKAIDFFLRIVGAEDKGRLEISKQCTLEYDRGQHTLSLSNGANGFRYDEQSFLLGFIEVSLPEGKRLINLHTMKGDTSINLLFSRLQWEIWHRLQKEVGFRDLPEYEMLLLEWEGESHKFLKELRRIFRERSC